MRNPDPTDDNICIATSQGVFRTSNRGVGLGKVLVSANQVGAVF